MLDLRAQLLPENAKNHVPVSMFDTTWMEDISNNHKDAHVIIIFEGVLMYYSEEQVKLLLNDVSTYFPEGEVYFDMCDKGSLIKDLPLLRDFQAKFKMGINNGKDIENIVPRLKLTGQYSKPIVGSLNNTNWQMLRFQIQ